MLRVQFRVNIKRVCLFNKETSDQIVIVNYLKITLSTNIEIVIVAHSILPFNFTLTIRLCESLQRSSQRARSFVCIDRWYYKKLKRNSDRRFQVTAIMFSQEFVYIWNWQTKTVSTLQGVVIRATANIRVDSCAATSSF